MIRDIPHFELGLVTNGRGEPSYDTAVAYSDNAGLERKLELEGEGAIDLMPTIVLALNSYDEMTAALRHIVSTLELKSVSVTGKHAGDLRGSLIEVAQLAIAKAEGRAPREEAA